MGTLESPTLCQDQVVGSKYYKLDWTSTPWSSPTMRRLYRCTCTTLASSALVTVVLPRRKREAVPSRTWNVTLDDSDRLRLFCFSSSCSDWRGWLAIAARGAVGGAEGGEGATAVSVCWLFQLLTFQVRWLRPRPCCGCTGTPPGSTPWSRRHTRLNVCTDRSQILGNHAWCTKHTTTSMSVCVFVQVPLHLLWIHFIHFMHFFSIQMWSVWWRTCCPGVHGNQVAINFILGREEKAEISFSQNNSTFKMCFQRFKATTRLQQPLATLCV